MVIYKISWGYYKFAIRPKRKLGLGGGASTSFDDETSYAVSIITTTVLFKRPTPKALVLSYLRNNMLLTLRDLVRREPRG